MPRRSPRPPELRYIYRQENEKHRLMGWQVLYTRGLERRICCNFSDQAYGGKEAALAEAQAFRDELLRLYAPPEPLLPPAAQRKLRVANKPSELIGIRMSTAYIKSGLLIYNWTGYARVDGKLKNRSWAIHKWGYETAFWSAANHRHSLTGQPLPASAPAPTPALLDWAAVMAELGFDIFKPHS